MRVSVKLFARLRELAGRADAECDVPEGSTVADVWRAVAAAHPALAPHAGSVSTAVNAHYAKMSAAVAEHDEIAFLPPVSGG